MKYEEVIAVLEENRDIMFDEYGYSNRRYLKRWIRVLTNGDLEIAETSKTFDRWANSREFVIEYTRIKPKKLLKLFDKYTNSEV